MSKSNWITATKPKLPGVGRGRASGSRRTQFAPGFSGNHGGRPTRPEPPKASYSAASDAILGDGNRLVTINDSGEELTVYQLVQRNLGAKAAKGDTRASIAYLERYENAQRQREELVSSHRKYVTTYKGKWDFLVKDAARRKLPAYELFPHPDNMVFDPHGDGVWLFGGLTLEEAAAEQALRSMRNLCWYWAESSEAALALDPENGDEQRYADFYGREGQRLDDCLRFIRPVHVGLIDNQLPPRPPDTERLRTWNKQLLAYPPVWSILRDAKLTTFHIPGVWDLRSIRREIAAKKRGSRR
ncbi:MAG: DUF5681 domain-containing protein [Devosia sp.]